MDSDNGSEFINKPLLKWCSAEGIQFTRSRPYHKNDNCYIEQKNNACVRNVVGYYRFSSPQERDALDAVYRPLCLLLNYFMPTQKLVSKQRIGSKIKKVYDANIVSPYQRLLASPCLSDECKQGLAKRYKLLNPVKLQQEVHEAVDALVSLTRTRKLEGAESLVLSALHAV
jgi:transposase InsO family protein